MPVNYTVVISGKTYGFDFEDTRIDVDATLDQLDVVNLYEVIKVAQESDVGIAFNTIANGSGLDSLASGIKSFLTVTLQSTWELNSLKSSGKFEVLGGNLIRADGADTFRDNPLITYLAYFSQAGVLVESNSSSSGGFTSTDRDNLGLARDHARAANQQTKKE